MDNKTIWTNIQEGQVAVLGGPPPPAPRHKHAWVANLSLLVGATLVALVIGLLILDLLVRLYHPITTIHRYAPSTDYLMEPNRTVKSDTDEFKTVIETNSYGLRDDDPDLSRKNRILILGDSFAFGYGVQQIETFPHLLEQELGNVIGRAVVVINAGHNGYDTRQEYGYFREAGLKFRPTTVVVAFTLNDLLSNSGDYFFSPVPPLRQLRHFPLRFVRNLAEYLKRPAKMLGKLGFNAGANVTDHFDCLRDNDKCRNGWVQTHSYLRRINELAQQKGIPMLLVNIPVRDQLKYNPNRPQYQMRKASIELGHIGEALGVPVIDLATCPEISEHSYYPKDGHWNAQGHRAGAQCIAEMLLPYLIE
jgi:lysophospholipase L1-like esterase